MHVSAWFDRPSGRFKRILVQGIYLDTFRGDEWESALPPSFGAAGHGSRCPLDTGITPLEFAMPFCRLPVVRFLLEQYRLRGREKRDMLREVEDRLPVDASGARQSLLFRIIRQEKKNNFDIKDEDMRAMVAFLVPEAGADIRAEGHMEYVTIGSQHSGRRKHILSPLHTAAHYGI